MGREAVRSELEEVLASSGFLALTSMVGGFVQVGAPAKTYEDVDFETCQKPCPTAAAVRALPGSLATSDAGRGADRGVGLAHRFRD